MQRLARISILRRSRGHDKRSITIAASQIISLRNVPCSSSSSSCDAAIVVVPHHVLTRPLSSSDSNNNTKQNDNAKHQHTSSDSPDNNNNTLRDSIIEAALEQVHAYGWTNDAIIEGLLETNRPLSLAGMVNPTDLIAYWMEKCQTRLEQDLLKQAQSTSWKQASNTPSQRLQQAIRMRLEYNLPYIQSKRWHEAMAIGATQTMTTTASQLSSLVNLIADSIIDGDEPSAKQLSHLERAGIGTIYATTELHLLTATSDQEVESTWIFLETHVQEWEQLRRNSNRIPSSDGVVAASAVASSLTGAVVSLLQPAVKQAATTVASSIMPHIFSMMQQQQQQQQQTTTTTTNDKWTRPSDYETTDSKK